MVIVKMPLYKERLKYIRESKKIKQEDIAKILNIKRGLYSQYETEYFVMPIKHLIKVCDYLDVSLDYLFSFSNEEKYLNILNTTEEIAGKRFKEFRKENKLTQNVLSIDLNTTQAVIANYERGRNFISTPFLYTICKKYNISADYLLGRINNPKYLK